MTTHYQTRDRAMLRTLSAVIGLALLLAVPAFAAQPPSKAVVLTIEGTVEFMRSGTTVWLPSRTNEVLNIGDRVRTGAKSRASVRLTDLSVLRLGESTTVEIEAPGRGSTKPIFRFGGGSGYFRGRDKPRANQFRTPMVSAAIRGTEFHLAVDPDGRTVLTLLDGIVDLENEQGQLELKSGEQAVAQAGQPLTKTAAIQTSRIIQWVLYYPAVLHSGELNLTPAAQQVLADSLSAYQSGDLLTALANYPDGREPASLEERLYLAALLLSVGIVDESENHLAMVEESGAQAGNERLANLAGALRTLIATVREPGSASDDRTKALHAPRPTPHAPRPTPSTASSLLAESYLEQSQLDLNAALAAARQATKAAPEFGFAWIRVAELEFSFGRTSDALVALENGLRLSPRHAAGLALKGFLFAAQNNTSEAIRWFDQAIASDGGLGTAWLGRGLCKIRRGDSEAGSLDLQTAAALEPQRALYRSYLGKAFANAHDSVNANKELELAKQLDPNDPTTWLYAALLDQQDNKINEAIRALETSQDLNDNRRVFRSNLLLDQDRAVRSANLAGIYSDAGMFDVSVREATRAVTTDYANYSAHLFLANSYNALRDPRQVNLRYETPWLTEFLVGNLLAPVGGGSLSPQVSQQEYSKLFERDRFGLSSSTEYFSSGDWIQSGSQFGTYGNTSYALDALYRTENGQRPNNDIDQFTFSAKFKQQITPQDSVYFQAIYYDFESGDVSQYYRQNSAHRRLRVEEHQEPMLLAGYHHEWGPGVHTLFLAGRLEDTFDVTDPESSVLVMNKTAAGRVTGLSVLPSALDYHSEFEAYTTELQQIWQQDRNALVAGGRYQVGEFESRSQFETSSLDSDLQRLSFYAYDHWQVLDPLWITAGLTYDRLTAPVNHRLGPLSDREETDDRISPKAGLIWTPLKDTVLRASYTRSLGGVSYDQSFRLEPVQVAGFSQAFRSLIPESVVGSLAGAEFDTWGAALEQKFGTGTYLALEAELLESDADRTVGVITATGFPPILQGGGTEQTLEFRERNLFVTANQLVGDYWSLGARYRLSHAELDTAFPEIPVSLSRGARSEQEATLHQLSLSARFNHPCGAFGIAEGLWSMQSNHGYTPDIPGDDFWQFNLFAGYRFLRRHAELRVGLLNLTDRDYRLNPLTFYQELPRERTFTASFRFYF